MSETAYFSKIEFQEFIGLKRLNILFLNLQEKELSYQVFARKLKMPAIEGIGYIDCNGAKYQHDLSWPAILISNKKTGFKSKLVKTELFEQTELFSYGIKLTDKQMCDLLPYCNALDFEPFRNRKMSMKDDGYIGYRDEVQMRFRAITNSHIPLIELPMDYYYDERHIWPSEKLYRYLLTTFFENNRKTEKWITSYGGFSLFF